MLERVTAGDALYRVIRSLTERRPLDDVLDEVLSQTRAMLDAAETYILISSDDQLILRASDGLSIGPNGRRQIPVGQGIEGLAATASEPVAASSVRLDPRHVDFFDRAQPIGSMLAVPLLLRGRLLGVLVSTRQQPGRFAGVETWWLEVFGGLVASLIASDHAYRVQERRTRQAEALLSLTAGDEAADIARQAVAEVARAIGAEWCGILLLDRAGTTFEHTLFNAESPDEIKTSKLPVDQAGPLGEVVQSGRGFVCHDIPGDAGLSALPFLRSALCLIATPLRAGSEPRGVLYAATEARAWLDGDDSFLELVAARVGLLLEQGELRVRQREVERQQAQMAARQEFLGIVSHELKTPVAVMKAYTELLLRRAERVGRSSEVDILHRMQDQAERMLAMIEQLLDLRRLGAGLLTLELSHFDLAEVVRRLAHEIELTTVSHNIAVLADGKMTITADRRRIEEVITNLLDNAVKYSPPGGTIRVRVWRDEAGPAGGSAFVSVQDEGPGVASPDRARIFERFYQASGRLHKGRAGLGLGLYISRELVRRHGGDVWLESPEGAGARFIVRLPVSGPQTAD